MGCIQDTQIIILQRDVRARAVRTYSSGFGPKETGIKSSVSLKAQWAFFESVPLSQPKLPCRVIVRITGWECHILFAKLLGERIG